MSLKIRLARAGSKKRPYYHVVIADARAPRDGRFIENIGKWNPMLEKGSADRIAIDTEKALAWIAKGAQPTDRVLRFLAEAGVATREARNNPTKAELGTKAKERIAMAEKKAADAIAAIEADKAAKIAAAEAEKAAAEAAKVVAAEEAAAAKAAAAEAAAAPAVVEEVVAEAAADETPAA